MIDFDKVNLYLKGIRKYDGGGTLKTSIKTDNYIAHKSGWGWWNSLKNLGDGKNHITFEQRGDLPKVNVNNEKQYLLDWYQNENTLKRIKNLTGERIPESLRKGTFINMNVNAYLDKKDDNSYYMRPWNSAGNYIKLSPNSDEVNKMHEINHSYTDLHDDLCLSDKNKYDPYGNIFKGNVEFENYDHEFYYRNPTEIHSRLMEIRKRLNKSAGVKIEKDELTPELLKEVDMDKYKPEVILYWINTIAQNNPQLPFKINFAKLGGIIKNR